MKHPKLKFKGIKGFKPTVIRNKIENNSDVKNSQKDPMSDDDLGVERDRVPEHSVKYRHVLDGVPVIGDDNGHGRYPDEIVVEIILPEMENANGVDLDITEKGLTMNSTDPAVYSLSLKFSYPVLEDQAKARFDKSIHTLSVMAPIRRTENEVKRLVSTDSGIDVDTGYCDDAELSEEEEPEIVKEEEEEDKEEVLFPAYTCNIYEDLMIFTLEVKNVAESSLVKSPMTTEEFGFCLKFSSMGAGRVPFDYKFYCALDMENKFSTKDPMKNMDVEVWDNNVFVKVTIPKGTDCLQYKVGSNPTELTLHSLPQLKALRKKREELKKVKYIYCIEDFVASIQTQFYLHL